MKTHHRSAESTATADLNLTPLIDVLLVLLVLLILTVPALTHKTALDLPGARAQAKPHPQLHLDIELDGALLWEGVPVSSAAELDERLRAAATAADEPVLVIRPDRRARYNDVAPVLAQAQRARVSRLSLQPIAD